MKRSGNKFSGGIGRRNIIRGSLGAGAALALGARADDSRVGQHWDGDYDVIVIGAGVAGACAAFEASSAGAKVLVVDSGGAEANASHGTILYMGGGTALQRACGVEDTPEEMMRYLLASTGPEPDEDRIRVFVEQSVEDFDWLVRLGVPFDDGPGASSLQFTGSEQSHPWRDLVRPVPRGHIPDVPGADSMIVGGGAWIQKLALAGGGAEILSKAVGKRLLRAEDGVVQGVVATSAGEDLRLRARRGVVLATGGFARNTDMVGLHAPFYTGCVPVDLPWNDGWGIRAGQAIGAGVRGMGAAGAGWFFYDPESRRQGILVNRLGQRFIPEDSYRGRVGNAIIREQQGVAYLIVDEAIMADGSNRFVPDRIAARAETLPGLEAELGIPATALQQTVEFYNRNAAKGMDPLLHKHESFLRPLEPPYIVLDATVAQSHITFFTLGGLYTSVGCEVLDVDGDPIPGLYAAGRVSAGIPCPYYFSSGLNLGECVTFGRIAGRNAASFKG